jgi:hypothetical protein
MQNNIDNYFLSGSKHRSFGIYSLALDRFILVDNRDLLLIMRTANILLSKLQTLVYCLPAEHSLTNNNCLNYSIYNKTNQKIATSSALVAGTYPLLRHFPTDAVLTESGVPEDFKSCVEQLVNIQNYAAFVNKCNYAINLTQMIFDFDSNNIYAGNIVPTEWTDKFVIGQDRSNLPQGIFFELQTILYLSHSIDDASDKIHKIWLEHSADQFWLRDGFYALMEWENPNTEIKQTNSFSRYLA